MPPEIQNSVSTQPVKDDPWDHPFSVPKNPIPNPVGDKIENTVSKAWSSVKASTAKILPIAKAIVLTEPIVGGMADVKDSVTQTPAQKIQTQQNNTRSLGNQTISGFASDKRYADIRAARELKNPFDAKTPELQIQAANAKFQRIISDPQFQKLKDYHQREIAGEFYEEMMKPIMLKNGLKALSTDEWLDGKKTVYGQEAKPKSLGMEFGSSMIDHYADTVNMSAKFLRYLVQPSAAGSDASPLNKGIAGGLSKAADAISDYANNVKGISNGVYDTFEPTGGFKGWAANSTGALIGDAPAYLMAGEVLGALGAYPKAVLPQLAEKAALSKGFKIGLDGLKASGEVFGVEKAQGQTTAQAAEDSAGMLILGPVLGGLFHGAEKTVGEEARLGAATWLKSLKWGAAKSAVVGDAGANSIAEGADKLAGTPSTTADILRSSVHEDDPTFIQAVQHEYNAREEMARELHPEKVSKAGERGVWRILSQKQRQNIADKMRADVELSHELHPLLSPETSVVANAKEIAEDGKANPEMAQAMAKMSKITGIKPEVALTQAQGAQAAKKFNLGSKADILAEAAHSAEEEYEPGEGAFASLKSTNLAYARAPRTSQITLKSLVSPTISTQDFINGTMRYLENNANTKSGKIYFENPEHHLLDIAGNSKAPAAVKAKAASILRNEMPRTYPSQEVIRTKAKWLDYHKDILRHTGHMEAEGNVFRSTRLTKSPLVNGTKWQKRLTPEKTKLDNINTNALLAKMPPATAKAFRALNKEFNQLAGRSASPEIAQRRLGIAAKLADIVKEYK